MSKRVYVSQFATTSETRVLVALGGPLDEMKMYLTIPEAQKLLDDLREVIRDVLVP